MATEYQDWFKNKTDRPITNEFKYANEKYGSSRAREEAPNWILPPMLTDAFSTAGWKKRALEEKRNAEKIDMPGAPQGFGPEYARQASMDTTGITPPPELTPSPSNAPGSGISDLFSPLFQALDQQRANANSRYTSNVGQIQNIYGQIVGARSADIGSIEKAYARLQAAAASRGEATISGMQDREADRVSGNQAVLQSMGVGDIGVAGNDVAAQSSATAQDVAGLNQANWSGMLDSMGATAQEVARADITSFGYRQGEDIATLQGAKEDYLQNVANQEFELKFQEQQAKLQAQQAAAAQAAAQEAATQEATNKQQQDAYDEILKYSGPMTAALTAFQDNGAITGAQAAQTTDAYDSFMRNIFSQQPLQGIAWNAAQAAAAFRTSSSAEGLDPWQKELIEAQIKKTF